RGSNSTQPSKTSSASTAKSSSSNLSPAQSSPSASSKRNRSPQSASCPRAANFSTTKQNTNRRIPNIVSTPASQTISSKNAESSRVARTKSSAAGIWRASTS